MRHWSASDGRMQFPQLVDTARKEPVLVFRHHRPVAAVISYERYLAFRETQIAALLSAATRIGGSAQARGMTGRSGGGGATPAGAGGTSLYGGNGGAAMYAGSGTNGSIPGGGGGGAQSGTSGAGAKGLCRVTTY
jgi:prevent-host-death family protein